MTGGCDRQWSWRGRDCITQGIAEDLPQRGSAPLKYFGGAVHQLRMKAVDSADECFAEELDIFGCEPPARLRCRRVEVTQRQQVTLVTGRHRGAEGGRRNERRAQQEPEIRRTAVATGD